MINTNDIAQASQDVAVVKQQVTLAWPTICAVAVIVARELGRFNAWCVSVAEFVIRHGGIGLLLKKLFWNPAAIAPVNPVQTTLKETGKES